MDTLVSISKTPAVGPCSLSLPASKSESNRALIIRALAGRGSIANLSTARDTVTMKRLLESDDHVLDVIDAGTTMRFLTAYLAVTGQDRVLTGTRRMCERPIGILVDALRQLGASIEYAEREGFPPLHLRGFHYSGKDSITMRGDVSSQYISALLMISPVLEKGLTLKLTGRIGSRPYIDMTLGIMRQFGVESDFEGNRLNIPHQEYREVDFQVAPDWSGASYWYSIVSLAAKASILLKDFRLPSLQGDSTIMKFMSGLGVVSRFTPEGLHLSKSEDEKVPLMDFKDCPDLAQTVAVTCAAKGIRARMMGLESLRIKETDRIRALQEELARINCGLEETRKGEWEILPALQAALPPQVKFRTYDDHRMAMAFAPLATLTDVDIENPEVVGKSYPSFWEDMTRAGFKIQFEGNPSSVK